MIIDADRVRATTNPRLGIVINLDDLEPLLREFIRESKPDLSQQLLLSTFLLWVNNKMKEQSHGTQETVANNSGN